MITYDYFNKNNKNFQTIRDVHDDGENLSLDETETFKNHVYVTDDVRFFTVVIITI